MPERRRLDLSPEALARYTAEAGESAAPEMTIQEPEKGMSKLGGIPLAIGQGADLASTLYSVHHGGREANGLLTGKDGTLSIGKLLAAKGLSVLAPYLLGKVMPRKLANAVGITSGSLGGAAAINNMIVARRRLKK